MKTDITDKDKIKKQIHDDAVYRDRLAKTKKTITSDIERKYKTQLINKTTRDQLLTQVEENAVKYLATEVTHEQNTTRAAAITL